MCLNYRVGVILRRAPFDTDLWLMGLLCLNKDDLTRFDLNRLFVFGFVFSGRSYWKPTLFFNSNVVFLARLNILIFCRFQAEILFEYS